MLPKNVLDFIIFYRFLFVFIFVWHLYDLILIIAKNYSNVIVKPFEDPNYTFTWFYMCMRKWHLFFLSLRKKLSEKNTNLLHYESPDLSNWFWVILVGRRGHDERCCILFPWGSPRRYDGPTLASANVFFLAVSDRQAQLIFCVVEKKISVQVCVLRAQYTCICGDE